MAMMDMAGIVLGARTMSGTRLTGCQVAKLPPASNSATGNVATRQLGNLATRQPYEELQSRRHPRGDVENVGSRIRPELLRRTAAAGGDRRPVGCGQFPRASAPDSVPNRNDRHAHAAR